MDFTKSQSDAINDRNSSLIISAGAGSGKTAVLTERILTRICDENDDCGIGDFLVVTFTNAAAKELSDRIRKKLTEKAKECPENKKIAENLAFLPLAKISTINSFCYDMVRTNFQKLGLPANVRIGDEAEMDVIRRKLMNEVVDEAFENHGDDGAFITAYEIFSSAKNDSGFVETLLKLHNTLTNIPDTEKFCQTVLSRYDEVAEKGEFFSTFFGEILKKKTEKLFSDNVSALEKLTEECKKDEKLLKKYAPALETERDFARQVLAGLDDGYEETKALLDGYKSASLSAVRGVEDEQLRENIKNAKKRLCDSVKEHSADFYTCDTKLVSAAAGDTKSVLECVLNLEKRFTEKLDTAKRRRRIIEFSDAERYTLKLLVKSTEPFEVTETAMDLRERFKEIYIDEYQDVNPIQDCIFKALARVCDDGTEYTRFMVGDVKQSIYGFRGAKPDIFLSYRDSFSDISSSSKNKRIFMNHNFRCCESVVKFSNYLFSKLMGEYFLDGDELIFARCEKERVKSKVKLVLAQYDKDKMGSETDEETVEAKIIYKKIKEIVGNPNYRNSDGEMFSYGSIAVITRSKTALKVYERYFNMCGIPVLSDVGESFYGKREIRLCCSILESIDNPMRDIPLAGFMRSFAGGFTDDELCIIKNNYKKTALYNSVKIYASSGKDEQLKEKCSSFIENLRELRRFSRGKSASELLWRIYTKMGLLDYCSGDGFSSNGENARRNLMKLYETALEFNKTSFRGTGAFVEYIDASMKKDEIKAQRVEGEKGVRLMTAHGSKGLEFPVCFVSNITKKFNKSDERQYLVFSEKEGFGCTLCDTSHVSCTQSDTATVRISTPFKKLVADSIDIQSKKEEARILYVALTRARDMLFMTGVTSAKIEKLIGEAKTSSFMKTYTAGNSFLSFILAAIADDEVSLPLYSMAGVECSDKQENELSEWFSIEAISQEQILNEMIESDEEKKSDDRETDDNEIDGELLEKLKSAAKFEYGKDIDSPAKITVSMLKKGLIDEEKIKAFGDEKTVKTISLEKDVQKKIPDFLSDKKTADATEVGTAMHMFMQFANYSACEMESDVKNEAERLFKEGFITEKQLGLLNYEKLGRFFDGEMYESIKNSGKIYREQRFNLEVSAFGEEKDDCAEKNILVQGVIDLFYENCDGTYTVVDFKTDRVSGENAEKTLIDRHHVQLEYYCRAVEEMTGKTVKNAYLYSFELSKAVDVPRKI